MARSSQESFLRYPLTVVFGSEANLRVMRALCMHGGWLSAPLLVRQTGLAKASVAAGLAVLQTAGAVRAAGAMRTVLYRIAPDTGMIAAINALFAAEAERYQAILEAVRAAARGLSAPRPVAVWLYGSVARGEDRAGSDLDLAVLGEQAERERLVAGFREALRAPAEQLGFEPTVVGVSFEDVQRLAAERDPWWANVCAESQPLLGPRPEEAVTLPRRMLRISA